MWFLIFKIYWFVSVLNRLISTNFLTQDWKFTLRWSHRITSRRDWNERLCSLLNFFKKEKCVMAGHYRHTLYEVILLVNFTQISSPIFYLRSKFQTIDNQKMKLITINMSRVLTSQLLTACEEVQKKSRR